MTITPEQIPDEVVAAALGNTGTLSDAYHMRRSIAAALAAWPGAFFSGSAIQADRITLPLPQEKRT